MTIGTASLRNQRGKLTNALWRVRQFAHALSSRPDEAVDRELRRLLNSDAQWALLARLTPFDRAHHLRVHALLVESGHDDPDLLRAALLHDVGKADERGRVSPLHRAAHVTIAWLGPRLLKRVAVEGGGFRHGLWLSLHHAEHGATLAARAGATERCCALIAWHAGPAQGTDLLLAALAAADHASIR